jgi:hypothetical protein
VLIYREYGAIWDAALECLEWNIGETGGVYYTRELAV